MFRRLARFGRDGSWFQRYIQRLSGLSTHAAKEAPLRLSQFIRENQEAVLQEWESFARTLMPSLGTVALRDHAKAVLQAIADDMDDAQSEKEQRRKSKGGGALGPIDTVGNIHARVRLEDGFDLDQVVAEFRALRASVVRLWKESHSASRATDTEDITRFDEGIDQALAESVSAFVKQLNRYRDQSLGIMTHDLRNPLQAIIFSSLRLAEGKGALPGYVLVTAARISRSAARMERMLSDLSDLTRVQLGGRLVVTPRPVELRAICKQVLEEIQTANPQRVFRFQGDAEVRGVWDGDQLARAISNLLGNALQHGSAGTPISLLLREEREEVLVEVHNEGEPISQHSRSTIFEPMMQLPRSSSQPNPSSSMGLGLFIVRAVMTAHGGTAEVTSSKSGGTTFALRFPQHAEGQRALPL